MEVVPRAGQRLRQIQELEAKKKEGASLDQWQLAKLRKKPFVKAEIRALARAVGGDGAGEEDGSEDSGSGDDGDEDGEDEDEVNSISYRRLSVSHILPSRRSRRRRWPRKTPPRPRRRGTVTRVRARPRRAPRRPERRPRSSSRHSHSACAIPIAGAPATELRRRPPVPGVPGVPTLRPRRRQASCRGPSSRSCPRTPDARRTPPWSRRRQTLGLDCGARRSHRQTRRQLSRCRLFVPAVPKLALPTRRRRVAPSACVPAVEGAAPVRIFRHPTARPRTCREKRVKDPAPSPSPPRRSHLPPPSPPRQ